jgi:hypothetical protein
MKIYNDFKLYITVVVLMALLGTHVLGRHVGAKDVNVKVINNKPGTEIRVLCWWGDQLKPGRCKINRIETSPDAIHKLVTFKSADNLFIDLTEGQRVVAQTLKEPSIDNRLEVIYQERTEEEVIFTFVVTLNETKLFYVDELQIIRNEKGLEINECTRGRICKRVYVTYSPDKGDTTTTPVWDYTIGSLVYYLQPVTAYLMGEDDLDLWRNPELCVAAIFSNDKVERHEKFLDKEMKPDIISEDDGREDGCDVDSELLPTDVVVIKNKLDTEISVICGWTDLRKSEEWEIVEMPAVGSCELVILEPGLDKYPFINIPAHPELQVARVRINPLLHSIDNRLAVIYHERSNAGGELTMKQFFDGMRLFRVGGELQIVRDEKGLEIKEVKRDSYEHAFALYLSDREDGGTIDLWASLEDVATLLFRSGVADEALAGEGACVEEPKVKIFDYGDSDRRDHEEWEEL